MAKNKLRTRKSKNINYCIIDTSLKSIGTSTFINYVRFQPILGGPDKKTKYINSIINLRFLQLFCTKMGL